MINDKLIKEVILPKIEKVGRKLDYNLIHSLIHNCDEELIIELKKFQNKDGGFGHGLEADIQYPGSNVAATDIAIDILEAITCEDIKKDMVKEIVNYFENTFFEEESRWIFLPKEAEEYPHAVWWNQAGLADFTYGNPNPEVVGFLYQYREHLKKLDINFLINKIVSYILGDFAKEASMHNLLSILKFYTRVDEDVQNLIKDTIQQQVDRLVEFDSEKWDEYCLEPYKVAQINATFLDNHSESLQKNLERHLKKLLIDLPQVNWNWYQYDEVFETVKKDWIGILTYNLIKALRYSRRQ